MDFVYSGFPVGIYLTQFFHLSPKLGAFLCLGVNLKMAVNYLHEQFSSGEAGMRRRYHAFNPPGGTVKLVAYGCQTTECCQTESACMFWLTSRSSLISLGHRETWKKRVGEREGSKIQVTRK